MRMADSPPEGGRDERQEGQVRTRGSRGGIRWRGWRVTRSTFTWTRAESRTVRSLDHPGLHLPPARRRGRAGPV